MKILILLALMVISAAQAERILFLGVVGSKSHKIGYMPIAEALAAKGHQVVVVNPFPGVGSSKNVREIIVRDIVSDMDIDWFEVQKDNAVTVIRQQLSLFSMVALNGYESLFENAEFQQIFQERAVDLIVMDCIGNDFALPFIDHLKVPFVYYSATSAIPTTVEALGIPKDYASVPAGMLDIPPDMTFLQRLGNMFTSEMFVILRKMVLLPQVDERARRDFPNARPIAEIERDASLCLMNHHPVTAYPRTLPPHVIPIGGLHVRPAKLLPEDLRKLADESTNGFIVFGLGSFISSSSLPPHLLDIFLRIFAKLPQRIFWKWEKTDGAEFPPNVVLLNWLPQQDLIGHPNCRLLISHGGLLGIQEAIYHKVPLLGLPFGNDQHNNMARSSNKGYALKLDWDKLTEEKLSDAINSLINATRYKENAIRISNLMRDEMLPGRDVATYWIDHVLRHGGTRHLQLPSRNLGFIQKHLIDVWLFLAGVVFLLVISFLLIVRCACNCLRKPSKQKIQ